MLYVNPAQVNIEDSCASRLEAIATKVEAIAIRLELRILVLAAH